MVRVEPVTREWAEALADGDAVFSEQFGVSVGPGFKSGAPNQISDYAVSNLSAADVTRPVYWCSPRVAHPPQIRSVQSFISGVARGLVAAKLLRST